MEALEDLTGAVCEVYRTSPPPEDLYQKVQRSLLESCLVACTSVGYRKVFLAEGVEHDTQI